MPRNPERDAQLRADRRRQIIGAATRVFSRKGLAATKMSDIASEAGLSHGHLYNHFKTKEDLLTAIVHHSQDTYQQLLEAMLEREGDAIGKLRWLAESLLMGTSTPSSYWVVLQAQASDVLPEETKADIASRMLHNRDLLARLIGQGQAEGAFAAGDTKEIAAIAMTLLHNLGLWEIRGLGTPSLVAVDYVIKLVRA